MYARSPLILFGVGLLSTNVSLAETQRDLDSHEHGAALLNIVLDGSSVFLEFESPWINLVGFEHAPSTDAQHAAMDDAMALLNQPEQLFKLDSESNCVPHSVEVMNTLDDEDDHHEEHEEDHGEEHAEHDEEHAEHEEDHDEEHEEHHDEEHAEHGDEQDTHSEIRASYELECTDINALQTLTVALFDHWGGIDELDVQLVTSSQQGSMELTSQNRVIEIN